MAQANDLETQNQHHLATLIDALSKPQTYSHPVESIQIIQTHISVVFLTGEYAYKLKKPVNFGFLDFSEASQRLGFCQKELTLNQRTAPELYLEVVPIFLVQGNVQLGEGALQENKTPAKQIDCVVKMRQFDNQKVLSRYVQTHPLSRHHIHLLAEQIANLHLSAKRVAMESKFGTPEILLKPMTDNFPSLLEFFSNESSVQPPNSVKNRYLEALHELEQETLTWFEQLKPDLEFRKAKGFIRSCHGDLHLDNIALINEKPTLFDAIEFNDYFSQIDVISDLAFLLVDLDFRQKAALGRQILSDYLHYTQDYSALKLLNFYKLYRSMVRAKISALQAQQYPVGSQNCQSLTQKTQDYIHLAQQQLHKNTPKLILLQGVSGSGKSYFASHLVEYLNGVIISSDRTRKHLFGILPLERPKNQQKLELYSGEMSQKTYQALLKNAKTCLQNGFDAIVDATFLRYEHRAEFFQMAQDLNLVCKVIFLDIDEQAASASITKRSFNDQDPSDADAKVMQAQLLRLEKPRPDEPSLTLNASDIRQEFPEKLIKKFLNLSL